MDGNGRWAERRHRPRSFGHREGQKALRATLEYCLRRGIKALTLFAFSSENWRRPEEEVGALMQLFLKALDREVDELHGHGVRIEFIGDLSAFSPELQARMRKAMEKTRANTALLANVAVNYGGRWDIANAARLAAEAVARGEIEAASINETCSPAGSPCPGNRRSISSSVPVASCASAISCFGSLPMRSWFSSIRYGLMSMPPCWMIA